VKRFSEGTEIVTDEDTDQGDQQQVEMKKTLQKFVKLCVKFVGQLSGA